MKKILVWKHRVTAQAYTSEQIKSLSPYLQQSAIRVYKKG